ncbi:MAG TPA: hypothetical protein VKW09_12760 [bacterium]|nr:hypothetical protein [bacterium]
MLWPILVLTEPQDDDVLTCNQCDGTSSYVEWLKGEIAHGDTKVTMEANACTAETQEHVVIELAIPRNKEGIFDRLEPLRSGLKSVA